MSSPDLQLGRGEIVESLDPRQTVFDLVAEPLTIHGDGGISVSCSKCSWARWRSRPMTTTASA